MKLHPLAELFPPMTTDEMNGLIKSIRENGQLQPVTTLDGLILDGRHRYEACKFLEIKPITQEFDGDDPVSFVVSSNFHRRHLTTSQRAIIAAELVKNSQKTEVDNCPLRPISHREASEKMNVSTKAIQRATKIIESSSKKNVQEIKDGKKTINEAVEELEKKEESKQKGKFDRTDHPIPEGILAIWNRSIEINQMLSDIRKIKKEIRRAQEEKDILYRDYNYSAGLAYLDNVEGNLKTLIPYAVCWSCHGLLAKACTVCKGIGFVNQMLWEQAPLEIRKIRKK